MPLRLLAAGPVGRRDPTYIGMHSRRRSTISARQCRNPPGFAKGTPSELLTPPVYREIRKNKNIEPNY